VDTTRKPRPGIQKLYGEMRWGGGGGRVLTCKLGL